MTGSVWRRRDRSCATGDITQAETYRSRRHAGEQSIRVEHVYIHCEGQAATALPVPEFYK